MHKLKSLMAKHRSQEAEFIRRLRISMYPIKELPPTPQEMSLLPNSIIPVMGAVFLIVVLFVGGCKVAQAEEYTDTQIVNAIRKAEGTWTYGIKSIKCSTASECRQICLTTVKRNRQRFINYGYKDHADFISYLASRYCPVGASNDPTGLNKNWQRNVRYFLRKGGA